MVILLKLNTVKDVATREEFIKFFLRKTDHGLVLKWYFQLSGEPDNWYGMNDIFGDMFDNLDNEWETKDEKDNAWTSRRYLLLVLKNIKKKNSDNELAHVDLLRSPWLPVFMTIFALTGTGITFFIKLWLIKKSGENDDKTEKKFKNCLQCGVMSIICNPLFVCSLVFGWALWIQIVSGIIFALCELLSLLLAYDSIANCYRIRKNSLSSAEYQDLLPKVENYLNQKKDGNENQEIKKEELKEKDKDKDENKNENQDKPEEEKVNEESKGKDDDNIPAESEDK